MGSIINEMWYGNIMPQEDSRNNTKEMKELIGYVARHNGDLEKLLTDEQRVIFVLSLPFLIYWVLHHVAPVFLQKIKENVYR